ncbi:opine metallophore biosynthesis dehydrogenase [Bacillus sp. KH172YL63]|uniref:opine metallophore biosynthesis dehydrogenase n=1 Tax=Bacillus sp. KH172YL63 TaxID=2709784 RepID=UPI00156711EA|nr:opine metallophore biosynthesis dehydrogenase [Bacillus sp. KH172YL63]
MEHTLIIGAGPAAVQTAVLAGRAWKGDVSVASRPGSRFRKLKENCVLKAEAKDRPAMSGEVSVSRYYDGFTKVPDRYSTIILCTPDDAYGDILESLEIHKRSRVQTVMLLSPGMGANRAAESIIRHQQVEVISLSNYYAATKFKENSFIAFTKAVKKRIYAASNRTGTGLEKVKQLLGPTGIDVVVKDAPIEAECRNITTYVHPPFFINDFSLDETLAETRSVKSLYKLYPEGPVTPSAISDMVKLWKECSVLVEKLGGEPVNLLQFLHDDNYPVREASLSRADIDGFIDFETVKQEYLLYIRYASLLIDPYSEPDVEGRYFEFSKVPYQQISQNEAGEWVLPRIPLEDYKKLKVISRLGRECGVSLSMTGELITRFERRVNGWQKETGRIIAGFCPDGGEGAV